MCLVTKSWGPRFTFSVLRWQAHTTISSFSMGLGSQCLHSKLFTDWIISPSPFYKYFDICKVALVIYSPKGYFTMDFQIRIFFFNLFFLLEIGIPAGLVFNSSLANLVLVNIIPSLFKAVNLQLIPAYKRLAYIHWWLDVSLFDHRDCYLETNQNILITWCIPFLFQTNTHLV